MKRFFVLLVLFLSFLVVDAQDYMMQIRRLLDAYVFFDEEDLESTKEHTFYKYILDNGDDLVIVFTSSKYNDCHACAVKMSVFLVKDGKLSNMFINTTEVGSWGQAPARDDITVYSSGNKFLIGISGGYMAQGYLEEYITFLGLVDGLIKELGNIQTGFSNEGAVMDDSQIEKWEGTITLKENAQTSLPDVLLYIKGEKKGRAFTDTKLYRFNGEKYVEL